MVKIRMSPVYTLGQIKASWEKYEEARVISTLTNGKWEDVVLKPGSNTAIKPTGTACRMEKLKNVMGFPEYLEKHGN